MVKMRLYTKEELIEVFKDIKSKGWIESGRQGNAGGVGNTIEDLYFWIWITGQYLIDSLIK